MTFQKVLYLIMMKQNYKVLNKKMCKGIRFRIVKDLDGIGSWKYIIQFETKYKRKYKRLWRFQLYQFALDEFECEGMLKRVDWMENL